MPRSSENRAMGGVKVVVNYGYNGGMDTYSDFSIKSRKRSSDNHNDFLHFNDMNDMEEDKRFDLL